MERAIVLAHAWATRHWALAGEVESIEEYIAFLHPLVVAMLETQAVVEMAKKERRPTAIGGRVIGGRERSRPSKEVVHHQNGK
jgi:hypothetical protein